MRIINLKRILLLLTLLLTLSYGSASAQSAQPSASPQSVNVEVGSQNSNDVSDELKTQAQILAELKAHRAAEVGYKNQITALQGQVKSQELTIQLVTEQKDFFKKEAEKREQAGTKDEFVVSLLRGQIADDRIRIGELERENDRLRDSRNKYGLIGGALGFGVCLAR